MYLNISYTSYKDQQNVLSKLKGRLNFPVILIVLIVRVATCSPFPSAVVVQFFMFSTYGSKIKGSLDVRGFTSSTMMNSLCPVSFATPTMFNTHSLTSFGGSGMPSSPSSSLRQIFCRNHINFR